MGDPLASMNQGEETDAFEEGHSDPVNEGQTTEEGEAESQDAGEDTGCSTDQDVDVEDDDRGRDQTSSEMEDKEEDRSDQFRSSALDSSRSFDPDNSLVRTESSVGAQKEAESQQSAHPQDFRRRITQATGNSSSGKSSRGGSLMEVQRSFSGEPGPGQGELSQHGQANETCRNFDLSAFNSQFIQEDLERTIEVIRAHQRQFSVVEQVNETIAQLMSQMTQQVGDASQTMLQAKMNGINERLTRLGEKYEKIKQLEAQMKESNQILDLLFERR